MKQTVFNGIDIIARDGYCFKGKCGLITNHTGVLRDLTSSVDILKKMCNLTALFGPEHGVRGDKQAGENIDCYTDEKTGLPVYSLYGNKDEATKCITMLDTVIFDIQDVGARFYTYQYTMTDTMKICAENGIDFIVLDRPNPIGGIKAEGTVLDRKFSSFVGRFPTPTRSALTIGEFALMMNDSENIGCNLTVIPMEGWKRELLFDDTDLLFIPPSPNIPSADTALCYIGTCIFEETNISEGRGTTKPFEIIGAPWLDGERIIEKLGKLNGVILRECSFTPTFSDYKNEFCHGIQLHITDREAFCPFETGILLLDTIRNTHKEFEMSGDLSNLLGTDEIFRSNFNTEEFLIRQAENTKQWQKLSRNWYLYR